MIRTNLFSVWCLPPLIISLVFPPLSLVLVGVMELWLAVAIVASLAKLLTLVSLLIGVEAARPFAIDSVPPIVNCKWVLRGPGGGLSSTGSMYDNIVVERVVEHAQSKQFLDNQHFWHNTENGRAHPKRENLQQRGFPWKKLNGWGGYPPDVT